MSDTADLKATADQASQAMALAGFPGPLLNAIGSALVSLYRVQSERDALAASLAEFAAGRAAVAEAMGIKRARLGGVEFQAVIEERAAALTASLTVAELQRESYETARAKGWHDGDETPPSPIRVIAWMGLICSEAAEAIEDARKGRMVTTIREDGKPEGIGSEMADIVIRVCDSAGALGIDMEAELRAKLAFNRTRGHRHGGKLA